MQFDQPVIFVDESDFDPKLINSLRAKEKNSRTLGGGELKALLDALPGAAARRISRLVPENFELQEIEIKVALEFSVPGILKSGGDAVVRLRKKSS